MADAAGLQITLELEETEIAAFVETAVTPKP
jgi:hypothetical protein